MEIFIILLLILLNGLFAMSEIALISARKSNLTAQAKQGNKRARQALKLAEDPNKFLSTVQIGITLIGILRPSPTTCGKSSSAGEFPMRLP